MSNYDIEQTEEAERMFNDKLAAKYFAIWDEYPIQRFTNEREGEALRKAIRPGSQVLVIGSGGGRELPFLLALGCEVIALDLSPEMLRIGQERFPDGKIEWRLGNANKLDFDENSLDGVVALGGVTNYLLSLEGFARECGRILRSDGVIVIDSFNSEFVGESPATTTGGRLRTPYPVDQIERALLQGGFTEVETVGLRYVVDLLPPAANAEPNHPARAGLLKILEGEAALQGVMPARLAKFLLTTARRAT